MCFKDRTRHFRITCDIVGPDNIDIDTVHINMWFLFRYLITHRDITIAFVCNHYFGIAGHNLRNLYVICNPVFSTM